MAVNRTDMNKAAKGILVILFLMFYFQGMAAGTGSLMSLSDPVLEIKDCGTNSGSYGDGDTVRVSFRVLNNSASVIKVKAVTVAIRDLYKDDSLVHKEELSAAFVIHPKDSLKFDSVGIWSIPSHAADHPYGVFITYTLADGSRPAKYGTFFRVVKPAMLTTFDIDRYNYHGLAVFALDGGMSAEYAVEKAGESLATGMSHSWKVNGPGSGPNPVYSTPRFLENSVKKTVAFYDSNFGSGTPFNSVVISTGIPSVPYLARAMRAPVLPLHFLVGANTVREIKTIVDEADRSGYPSYATLGYDGSMPNVAVAWIKLLDLPGEYIDFLKRHHVKNVIILGATGSVGGEATAKKVISAGDRSNKEKYAPGSVFILYPGGGSAVDTAALDERIKDIGSVVQQADFTRIADWESGIIPEQVKNYSRAIRRSTTVKGVWFITGKDDGDLYKLATYVTLAFVHKNIRQFGEDGTAPVKGVILNPYLISNPVFESRFKYIPLVYWQGNPPKITSKELTEDVKGAISSYFPDVKLGNLDIWLNSSRNFGGAERANKLKRLLESEGFTDINSNDCSFDEIWDPSDGMHSPCETKAQELLKTVTPQDLKEWDSRLVPLAPMDLVDLAHRFPAISVTPLN
jgi:hypothetical protein